MSENPQVNNTGGRFCLVGTLCEVMGEFRRWHFLPLEFDAPRDFLPRLCDLNKSPGGGNVC